MVWTRPQQQAYDGVSEWLTVGGGPAPITLARVGKSCVLQYD